MRASQLLIATLKETPADAEVISHQLMLRAGMIRRLTSGLYTWLPLGLRTLRKVEAIVREGMNRAGAQEVLMPAVQPADLWQESGRWEQYGPELLFFIVPGVIAYAVDFSNGTIYLPSASSASVDVHHLNDAMDMASLEKLLSEKAGQPVSLENELLVIEEMDSLDEALAMVRMSGVLDEERLATM